MMKLVEIVSAYIDWRKQMKRKYYAVVGKNAIAIFDEWGKVEYYKNDFQGFHTKKFPNFIDASKYALNEFNKDRSYDNQFDGLLEENKIYYMDKENEFYGVYGSNALAVFTTWEKLCDSAKYFRKISCKKFDLFEDAEDYAIDGFNKYQDGFHAYYGRLNKNWVTYSKNIL